MKNKVFSIGLLLLILVIFTGYVYQWLVQNPITHVIKVEHCQIEKSLCRVVIGKGQILELNILPRGILEAKPFVIDAYIRGVDVDEVMINFEGVEINHHLPSYYLQKQEKNHFKGKGLLTLCSLSTMHWLVNVTVITKKETWKVLFPFETSRNLGE